MGAALLPRAGWAAPIAQDSVRLPPGAVRLVSVTRRGDRLAVCVEEPGGPIEDHGRRIARTRVWIDDGAALRQAGTAQGSCDPAWSVDGERVAVVAPDGLWVFSADLRVSTHLVDTRPAAAPADDGARRLLARPAWSPDGAYLAFVVRTDRAAWVEAVQARTGIQAFVSDPGTDEFDWEPDSRSLRVGTRVERLNAP